MLELAKKKEEENLAKQAELAKQAVKDINEQEENEKIKRHAHHAGNLSKQAELVKQAELAKQAGLLQ